MVGRVIIRYFCPYCGREVENDPGLEPECPTCANELEFPEEMTDEIMFAVIRG